MPTTYVIKNTLVHTVAVGRVIYRTFSALIFGSFPPVWQPPCSYGTFINVRLVNVAQERRSVDFSPIKRDTACC